MVLDSQQMDTFLIGRLPQFHVESPDPLVRRFGQSVLVASHQQRKYRQRRLLDNHAAKLPLGDHPAVAQIADKLLNIHPVAFGDMAVSYTHLAELETRSEA